MDNTSKYGEIILLKLKVAYSLTSVYNQIIPKQHRVKNMLKITKATHTLGTFYKVWNAETGFIVFQDEDLNTCKEYVKNNGGIVTLNKLSKATLKELSKLDKVVSLDCNIALYGEDEALEMDYQGTLTVWLDSEADHEGDAIYKLYKTSTGFKAVLWDVWTNDTSVTFPQSFEDEKGLRAALKMIHKNK